MADLLLPDPFETQTQYVDRAMNARADASIDDVVATFRKSTKGVKVLDGDRGTLGGWAIPFGGPVKGGKDLDGEFFAPDTNFCLDWFPEDGRPVLYDHGFDRDLKLDVIGRQTSKYVDGDLGIWAETQLNMAHRYGEMILDLAKKGVLGYSSGALGGYVQREKNGKIAQWPWIELTATVRPANPYALIAPEAVKHFQGIDLPKPIADAANEPGEPAGSEPTNKRMTIPDGMSLDDARRKIENAIRESRGGGYCYATDIRDGEVVVCTEEDEHYRYAFKLGGDGEVTIAGEPEEVERRTIWVPVSEGKSLATSRAMGQLHQSMKAMHDLHEATCSLGGDCLVRDIVITTKSAANETVTAGDEPVQDEDEARRQKVDAILAAIKL